MIITQDVEDFLEAAGYEYYCFISWPHTENREISDCARRLKIEIESALSSIFYRPRVFLDEKNLKGGDDWARVIPKALCKSVSMVAICAPIYFHSSHKWCEWEWAGMEMLSKRRLCNEDFTSLIPVMVRKSDSFPSAVSKNQYIDISKVNLQGRRYYNTKEFRVKIDEIIERIQKIAQCIKKYKSRAECNDFKLPQKSTFSEYKKKKQPFPFRKA